MTARNTRGLRIRTKCQTTHELVGWFHRFCDETSIFIATPSPRAEGIDTAFSIDLASGEPALVGEGVVLQAWTSRDNRYGQPGMQIGVRSVTKPTARVLEQLLIARAVALDAPPSRESLQQSWDDGTEVDTPSFDAMLAMGAADVVPVAAVVPTSLAPQLDAAKPALQPVAPPQSAKHTMLGIPVIPMPKVASDIVPPAAKPLPGVAPALAAKPLAGIAPTNPLPAVAPSVKPAKGTEAMPALMKPPATATPPAGTPAAAKPTGKLSPNAFSVPAKIPQRDSSPSIPQNETSPSVAKRESSPSVAQRDRSPSVPQNESSPSMAKRESSPSVAKRDSSPSVAKRDSSPSVAKRDSSPSIPQRDAPASVAQREAAATISQRDSVTNILPNKPEPPPGMVPSGLAAMSPEPAASMVDNDEPTASAPAYRSRASAETIQPPMRKRTPPAVQVDARRLPLEAPRVSQRPQTPPQPAPAVSLEAEARSSQSSIEALPEPPAADIPLIVPTEPASSRVPRAGTVMGSGGIPRTPARPFTPARPITPVTFAAEDSEAPAIEQPNAFALGTDDATSPPLDDDIGPAVSTDLPMSPELASVLDEDRIAAQAPVSTRTPPLGVPRAPDPDAQAALIAPPLDVEYTDVDPTRDGAAPQLEVAMPAEQRVRESTSPLLAWSKDEPEPPKRRRRGIVLAFIAVAAVCFAAGGVFVAMQTRGDEPAKSAANPNDQVTTPAPAVAPTTPAAAVVPTSAAPTPATPTVGEPAAPAPQQAAAPTPEPAAAPAESATPEHAAAPTPEPVAATPEPAAAPTPEPVAAPTSEPVVDTAPEKPEPPAVAKPTKPTQAATKPVVKKVVKKPAPARPTKVRRTAPKAACSGLDCL